jgi:uncharacterized protein YneF (UPF0154 family)
MPASRRNFMQSAAVLGAAAQSAAQPPAGEKMAPLPTVPLGGGRISRLIVGSNPLYAYSHHNRILDGHMREWMTADRRIELLHRAERHGIGTWQAHYNDEPRQDYLRYRAEGGKMSFVLLADFELMKNPKIMPEVVKAMQPLGVAHHGGHTDRRVREGRKDAIRDFLKTARDCGVLAGVSTHNPAVIDIAESEGWEAGFYMTCLYRITRTTEELRREFGEAPLGEPFFEKDPERMCKMVKATKKPCLVFKVMGAGRISDNPKRLEEAVRYVYANIKPSDALIVGMYGKFKDEVAENTALARRILA